jgi:hypothetical protein
VTATAGWRRRLATAALAVAALSATAACSDQNPLGLPVPATIRVTAPESELFLGQSIQLLAVALNDAGEELPSFDAAWSSSNSNVARVSSTGLLEAVGVGSATIRATMSGKSSSVDVSVVEIVTADTVDVGPNTTNPRIATIRVGGFIRFRFGATAGDVTFRPMQNGVPTNIPATANALVQRSFFTVGDFVYDNAASPGTTGTIRVR